MTNAQSKFSNPSFFLLLAAALAGSVALIAATSSWGIGACQDSAMYLAGARNILNGYGYRNYADMDPIIQWPPFFSFTLALLGKLGPDPLLGARILHVILFGVSILMVGFVLKKFTRSSAIAFLGSFLMLTSTANIRVHSMAWSEPWFLFLAFLGFFSLNEYLGTGKKFFFFASALLAGLACLDRYAGVSVIAAGALILLLLHQKSISKRLTDAVSYTILSALPLGLWLVRNYIVEQSLVNRDLGYHLPASKYSEEALRTLSAWVLHDSFPHAWRHGAFAFAAAVVVVVSFVVIFREVKTHSPKILSRDNSLRLAASLAIFSVCNAALELAHLIFMNAHANANDRHFVPFFIAGVIGFLILVDRLLQAYPKNYFLKSAVTVFFVCLAVSNLYSATHFLQEIYDKGSDHTSRQWKTSPTLARAKTLADGNALIYSNDPSIIYVLTNQRVFRLPRKYESRRHYVTQESTKKNDRLAIQLGKIKKKLIDRDGYIVLLDERLRWFKLSEDDLKQHMPLVIVEKFSDGAIYQIQPTPNLETVKAKSL